MATEHSITIQVAPFSGNPLSPGHVAVVINTPTEQTYAGFGPNSADQIAGGLYSELGQFDVQKVPRDVSPRVGTAGEKDYSTVLEHNDHSTFTISVSKEQANAALAEIARLGVSHGSYNGFTLNVCSTIINQILRAASLPEVSVDPSSALAALEGFNKAFLNHPNSPNDRTSPWRGLQKDYAYTGRGYDTPSEFRGGIWSRGRTEVDHVPLGLPGQIGDNNGIGDWWRNTGEDPKKMSLTANESSQPPNTAARKADSDVTTATQSFQGPNGRAVDATGWQNGMFDPSLGPVLQAPELRLVPPQQQGAPDSSAFMRSPVDRAAASGATPVPPEDANELLKLRSIIQALGSRGLFPIQ